MDIDPTSLATFVLDLESISAHVNATGPRRACKAYCIFIEVTTIGRYLQNGFNEPGRNPKDDVGMAKTPGNHGTC